MNAGLAFQDVAISAAYAMAGCHYTEIRGELVFKVSGRYYQLVETRC